MRIGLVNNANARWSASASFTKMLGLSLKAACQTSGDQIGLLTRGAALSGLDLPVWPIEPAQAWPGEHLWRRLRGASPKTAVQDSLQRHDVDVALPFLDLPHPIEGVATIGWIPDFQATHLPQYFDDAERTRHAQMLRNLTENTSALLLSSKDAQSHLREIAPSAGEHSAAIPFPSLFAFFAPGTIRDAVARYHLPAKFALMSNQVWRHKNHAVVIDALKVARSRGVNITLVCTGLPLDHRDPSNQPTSDLLQAVAQAGLHENVRVLGAVPFSDLVDLLRSAAVVIQPSRFEGWSTVVQDALALGRPVLCSGIGVHREQAPNALGFFGVDAPEELAQQLVDQWPDLPPGPDLARESAALERERAFAAEHGQKLLALCKTALTRVKR